MFVSSSPFCFHIRCKERYKMKVVFYVEEGLVSVIVSFSRAHPLLQG